MWCGGMGWITVAQDIDRWNSYEHDNKLSSGCKILGFHGSDYEECHLLGCYAMWILWLLQEPHGVTSQKTAFFIHTTGVVFFFCNPILFAIYTSMKNAVFLDVTPCGSCKNQHYRGTYCLHHQGEKNQWARNITVTSNCSMLRSQHCS
jgi:hypothetical protein